MLPKLAALLGLTAILAAAQAPVVEIENNWVRVLRVKQAPHQQTAARAYPATVVVYLTDVHQKVTGPDGTSREISHRAGETAYFAPVQQSEENLSSQPFEEIRIELKAAQIKEPHVTLDPVKLDPKYHLVDFENDRVRILRTILEPHIKSPMHEHPSYVVVYLTDLHTTMKLGDGKVVDNPRRPGEVAWRDPMKHQTENIGDHTAMEIQVELKSN